jgi:hypothetical protein
MKCGHSRFERSTKTRHLHELFQDHRFRQSSRFPIAYVNYRLGKPKLTTWWGQPNNEVTFTNNLSAEIGVNSNTGTNQPEFFAGYAAGFSRVLIHAGLHYGLVENLAGGYTVNNPVPTGFTSSTPMPINWSYQPLHCACDSRSGSV